MKHLIFLAATLVTPLAAGALAIDIDGSRHVKAEAAKDTGLEAVYVLEHTAGVTVSAQTDGAATLERFSSLGGGYAQEVTDAVYAAGKLSWTLAAGDMGYIVSTAQKRICLWFCDYSQKPFDIGGLELASSDCDRTVLRTHGSAPEISYYTINGRKVTLSREIPLSYNTLVYNADTGSYEQTAHNVLLPHADGVISAAAPLCDTYFTLGAGRFATAFGDGEAVQSPSVSAVAVQAVTQAVQTPRDADNEQKTETGNLGGSAPCEVSFTAAVTDAAVFRRWEIAADPAFDAVDLIFDQLDFTYTFTEGGTHYVRFLANNADATCEYTGDTYTISIGESKLDCPNAFSPGNADGVNDEWKVTYSSIVSFHCDIFNRWGQRVATLTDPSQGWDGKVHGKVVKSGVYFYVIAARGADGKEYKLSGDINIIGSKQDNINTGTDE